jgi:hypothetical protein
LHLLSFSSYSCTSSTLHPLAPHFLLLFLLHLTSFIFPATKE